MEAWVFVLPQTINPLCGLGARPQAVCFGAQGVNFRRGDAWSFLATRPTTPRQPQRS